MVLNYDQPPAIEISVSSQYQQSTLSNQQEAAYQIGVIRCLFNENLAKGNLSIGDEIFSPHVILHGPDSLEIKKGIDAIKDLDTRYSLAFRQEKVMIDEIFSYGNKVFVRWMCQGIHQGNYLGIPATNKHFTVSGMSIYHFDNGKVDEIWQSWDRLGLFEQLGIVHIHPASP